MSDKPVVAPEHPAEKTNTSRILFDDSQSGRTVAKFHPHGPASECKTNAPDGKVLTLTPGHASGGCEFKGMKDMPKGLSHLDFPSIYNQAAPSTVRFDAHMQDPHHPKHKQEGPMGSGAIIGKDIKNGECLVATANHVVASDKKVKVTNQQGITADGGKYPAIVRYQDPKHDTAVVALKTGADTERVCKPFTPVQDIAKEAGPGKPVVSLGFAQGSKAMYASPGKSEGVVPIRNEMSPGNIRELGLDPKTKQLRLDNNVKPGQSGGPVVTPEGRLTGLNQSGPEGNRGSSAVPLDQKRVDELLAKSRKPEAGQTPAPGQEAPKPAPRPEAPKPGNPRPEGPHPEAPKAAPKPEAPKPGDAKTHKVTEGESLWKIAKDELGSHGRTARNSEIASLVKEIIKLNGEKQISLKKNPNLIHTNMQLNMPAGVK